jgi:hypothetical protein
MEKHLLEEFRRAAGLAGSRYPEYQLDEAKKADSKAAIAATKALLTQMGTVKELWGKLWYALNAQEWPQGMALQTDVGNAKQVFTALESAAYDIEAAARFWLKP